MYRTSQEGPFYDLVGFRFHHGRTIGGRVIPAFIRGAMETRVLTRARARKASPIFPYLARQTQLIKIIRRFQRLLFNAGPSATLIRRGASNASTTAPVSSLSLTSS